VTSLASHPAYDHCFRIYRNALLDWHASGAIQNAARTLGMDCRAYCDARLTANQFAWAANATTGPFTYEHASSAYEAAVRAVCGA
jgi:hypothetical protein